jgi:serine/threonine protein phosphatase 1
MWMHHYGDVTMPSFKVKHINDMPQSYINWFRDLKLVHSDGLRTFAHAGIQRGLSPSSPLQSREYILWARDEFLYDMRKKGGFVVHGHTPQMNEWPDLRSNRLNLDTGAVFGSVLCGAVFDNTAGIYPTHFINQFGKIIEAKEVAQFDYEQKDNIED